ncbi:MAG: DUF459 domain-containing protein [Rhizobiaceae bacterium]
MKLGLLPNMTGIRLAAAAIAILFAAVSVLVVLSAPASAQERKSRTLFDLLFGGPKAEEPETSRPARSRSTSNPTSSNVVRVPEPDAVEKLENARVILVVGDFLADGLAEGLVSAYAESPGVRIVSSVSGSSGLVRDDYYDWPNEIGAIVEEQKPSMVVVMLGSNDRQQLLVGGMREKVRSESWTAEYTRRVESVAKNIRDRGLPLFWVGVPSFKTTSMTADMLAFNDIYRTVSENLGGEFVDIWDGFVDETGVFSSVGPDINGQRVRLRGSDGINMTRAGKRKMAFYLERPLNRMLGSAAGPGIASLGPQEFSPLVIDPADIPEITRTNPVALGGAELDGGDDLLGAAAMKWPREARTPAEKLSLEGIAPAAQTGRADDFSAPPYAAVPLVPTDPTETTTAISE